MTIQSHPLGENIFCDFLQASKKQIQVAQPFLYALSQS